MSDYIIKIIPRDPSFRISDSMAKKALNAMQDVIQAQRTEVETHEMPQFVDCGSNLESICCPVCGRPLEFDWWGEQMDIAARDNFTHLEIVLPCCGKKHSLNDLQYNFPCGFACTELAFWNPEKELSPEDAAWLEDLLGIQVRVIRMHL